MKKINIEDIDSQISDKILNLSDEQIASMDLITAEAIKNKYHGKLMLKLPNGEVQFFEWLKENDPDVWKDLWEDTPDKEYIVSIDFLPYLIRHKTGFPICDLINNENCYFVPLHINSRESEMLSDTLKVRLNNKEPLTPAQLLLLEISLHPIDIWHFAYKYKLDLEKAKNAVRQLVDDETIVHFKDAEHLANFIEI